MRNAHRTPLGKLKSFITLFCWREWFTFGNELTRTRTKETEAHFSSHMLSKMILLKLPLRKPTSAIEDATDTAIATETAAVENGTTVAERVLSEEETCLTTMCGEELDADT